MICNCFNISSDACRTCGKNLLPTIFIIVTFYWFTEQVTGAQLFLEGGKRTLAMFWKQIFSRYIITILSHWWITLKPADSVGKLWQLNGNHVNSCFWKSTEIVPSVGNFRVVIIVITVIMVDGKLLALQWEMTNWESEIERRRESRNNCVRSVKTRESLQTIQPHSWTRAKRNYLANNALGYQHRPPFATNLLTLPALPV